MEPSKLPPGWVEQWDATYNRPFYVNTNVNPPHSQWEYPSYSEMPMPSGPTPAYSTSYPDFPNNINNNQGERGLASSLLGKLTNNNSSYSPNNPPYPANNVSYPPNNSPYPPYNNDYPGPPSGYGTNPSLGTYGAPPTQYYGGAYQQPPPSTTSKPSSNPLSQIGSAFGFGGSSAQQQQNGGKPQSGVNPLVAAGLGAAGGFLASKIVGRKHHKW